MLVIFSYLKHANKKISPKSQLRTIKILEEQKNQTLKIKTQSSSTLTQKLDPKKKNQTQNKT